MDAFFASVEQRDFPHLKGLPVVVGGSQDRRGVVAAASYEARKFGIRSAMSMGEAFRRCSHLHRQPIRMETYVAVSREIREIFERYTSRVEPLSIDEAFLDLTETSASLGITATRLAADLRAEIFQSTGLTASAGVAPNKFLAKIASDVRKPNGLTVVVPEKVEEFLAPLPVGKVWGIGPSTVEKLAKLHIHTIAELRTLTLEQALRHFGKTGLLYYRLARGHDDRSVEPRGQAKSISTEETFAQNVRDPQELIERLAEQAEEVAQSCRQAKLSGCTVVLKLRYDDFSTITRSHTLSQPTRLPQVIFTEGVELLNKTDYQTRPVRLLGIGLSGLLHDDRPRQLSLFEQALE